MSQTPPILQLSDARLRYGARPLFDGIDLTLSTGERACLVGRNGSGKSTLMGVMAGEVALDAGARFLEPGRRIGRLSQKPDFAGFSTALDYVATGLPADRSDELHRAEAALDLLSIPGDRSLEGLSGGEQRRVQIARAVTAEPDLLLLDEPTNHLDLPTIEWLEGWLARFPGALMVISHDRALLSAVATRVFWLDRGRLHIREGGFAAVEDWQAQILAEEAREERRIDQRIATETQWLREGLTARRTRNQGRVRALQQLRQERRERIGPTGRAGFAIAEAAAGGKLAIEATDIAKAFDGQPIVEGFSTRVLRGDRIGVVGPNGAGKSTLVRLLTGALVPDRGGVRLGARVETAYFDQTRASLDPEASIRRTLLPLGGDTVTIGAGEGGRSRHIASYLRDFLFDPAQLDSPVRTLSGGEQNRLLLARLFARPANLLVLDEPTNDLDMETLDLLEELLAEFKGTLLLVSHDRDFLDRLVTSVIAVEGGGRVAEYVGGYSDYLRQRPPPRPKRAPPRAKRAASPAPSAKPAGKLTYKEQRALDELPGLIERLEAQIARLEAELGDPEIHRRSSEAAATKAASLEKARATLEAAETRWLELSLKSDAARSGS